MIRANLTSLPPEQFDALRTDLSAWQEFDDRLDDLDLSGWNGEERPGVPFAECELHDTWDALHFLLDPARRKEPLTDLPHVSAPSGAAVVGWHPMPEFYFEVYDDLPRYNTAEEVRAIAAALEKIDFEALREEFSASEALSRTYTLAGRRGLELDDTWKRTRYHFEQMRPFYALAAERGRAVLVTRY